uniref:tudor domain-containing 6 n=1 Tax=Semicossyphus pulcher TaxID=241346 RepID=UPI0037E825A9
MTSIIGLPTRGSDVTILITKVHLHPLCMLVEFWGKFSQERTADYKNLAKDIQSPGNVFQEFEGNSGDQCLVQIEGTWYRSRIVSRNGSKYSVFLIDKGITFNTSSSKLAWGKKKNFHLPPEVEFCVLANVLPLSPENRWSPVALEFLKSLSGKSVKAEVQDLLLPHRTFLLHIPCISKQMYEMGIAKKLSPDMFQDFVLLSQQSQSGAEVPPGTGVTYKAEGERLHKQELFLYPELQAGTVETVIVTDVTNPQRIFCQLKVFSQELNKLSEQITQRYEGRMTNCLIGPEMVGFPCAARGSDSRWYRSVLQQVFPNNQWVEVLNVDYGTKQFVHVENVRPLATEFFRMPVVTYICSLHGIIDKGVGWTTSQIDYLRSLLLHKTVIAKFDYQSISEGVHYVTLYGNENSNINNLFVSHMSCSLESEKTLGDYALRSTAYRPKRPFQQEGEQRKMLEKEERKAVVEKLPAEDLSLNSSHVAVVQHVSDPSKFWIQTQNYANELDELMDRIYHLYKDPVNKDVVRNPTVGLYCASKAEDGDFYRATVAEVGETKIKVFFVDYGNTEVVDRSNLRTLPDEFKKLPCLALKCTLAGIRPKDEKWSQSACEFFIKAIKDKMLNVHVTAKYDEGYVVQLADPEAQEERDLAVLMCSSGLAERAETKRKPKAKITMETAIPPTTQLPDARLSGVHNNNGMPFQTGNAIGLAGNQKTPTFKEYMFSTGSVLDVGVSYMESPNDFWCQLVQNAGLLKLLMRDIQAYYAGSGFHPPVETACVARHPENRMWYRALIIHKHETPHVDVLFVDYGQTETVSLYDLRRICPQFLTLQGQAFRCSLLNPVDPTSATNEWNEDATARFHSFVETAASNFVILKCTIYAVMYSEQKIVFNIVDLETPFESVSTSMVNLLKSAPPKKAIGPSFCLNTYYYSTHNVKTGTEEQVTVTCVNNVGQFYCQLERNADVIKDLKLKVSSLCHQLENVKLPTVFGTLCFAKYTDGQWYRGQIKATKPAIRVHFVDYGDTIVVEKSDLLPVPREANDIMSVPVQALVCCLSDVPADVSNEMNKWFETSVTECKFRALVVAREPDGKLQVELYHGNTQINSKIKKMFRIEMHSEEMVVHQGWRALDTSVNHTQKSLKSVPKQVEDIDTTTTRNNLSASKPALNLRDGEKNLQTEPKPSRNLCENGQKVKAAPLKLYQPPHKMKACERTQSNTRNGFQPTSANIKPTKASLPAETKQLVKSTSPATESQKGSNVEKVPKLEDLPSKSIAPGIEEEVYVSHCNSPLSFYVQLLREEDEIFSLVEKLNDPQSIPETEYIKDVHPGDLVQAEFAEDSSWYRAVVREIHSNSKALVEFVDFGNTAIVPVSKIRRTPKSFLQLPLYSTHCMLNNAATLDEEKVLDPEVVSAFKEDIGGNGEKVLKCKFIKNSGSVWGVSLENSGMNLVCKIPSIRVADGSEITSDKLEKVEEKPAQNSEDSQVPGNSQVKSFSLCYPQQDFSEGQKLEVYITTTNDAQTFWCQPADSEELEKITLGVAEVGNTVDHKHNDPGSLSPGSPCVALFSDDRLWYRAEVINKDGDDLFVFFVDYGNNSKVRVTDVREIPRNLIENPPQAFLCELEGFNASNGSWESGAVDELSALTLDKTLQLTVTRVTREEGKIKCLVQIECEGRVINEALRTWWRSSMTENKPAAVELTTSYKTSLQHDRSLEEIAPPDDQLKYQNPEMDASVASFLPPKDHSDSQSVESPADSHTADDVQRLAKSSEDSVHSESFLESPEEEKDQILSEGNMTTEPLILKMTESLREPVSNEGVNIVPTMMLSQTKSKDILPCDGGIDKTMLPPECNKCTEEEVASVMDTNAPDDFNSPSEENPEEAIDLVITMTHLESLPGEVYTYCIDSRLNETMLTLEIDKGLKEKDASMMDTIGPDDSSSQLDENPKGTTDELGIMTTDLEALPGKVHTCSMESSFDMISDPTEEKEDREVSITRDNSITSTTVKMVPREVIRPSESLDLLGIINNTSEDLKQTDVQLPSCVVPVMDAYTEQGVEAEDDVPKEEVSCVTTHVKNVLMTAVETMAEHKDTYFDLLADTDKDDSVRHACVASSQVLDDGVEDVTCSVEEACLTDVCTDPNEPSDREVTSARDTSLSCVTAEEMVQSESLLPCSELHNEPSIEASSKHEIEVGDISRQDEALFNKNNSMTEEETSALYEDRVSALQSDSQPQVCTVPCEDMNNLVEEVTCLVAEICLTDVCRDPQQETETDENEQLVPTPPEQKEDFDDGVLEKESSFSDDSFEEQLSKITHLSLMINDCSADVLPVERQSEE